MRPVMMEKTIIYYLFTRNVFCGIIGFLFTCYSMMFDLPKKMFLYVK